MSGDETRFSKRLALWRRCVLDHVVPQDVAQDGEHQAQQEPACIELLPFGVYKPAGEREYRPDHADSGGMPQKFDSCSNLHQRPLN